MGSSDLRTFLQRLEKERPSDIFRVSSKEVETEYEIPSLIRRLQEEDEYPLVLAENIKGHPDFSIVSNVCASRERVAFSLDSDIDSYVQAYKNKLDSPIEPIAVDDGPIKDVVKIGRDADLNDLPILTHTPEEPGPYIDAGVAVLKDTNTDRYNLGIYRIHQKGPRRATMKIGKGKKGYSILEAKEENDEPLEFALYNGHHPGAIFGTQGRMGEDVYEIIGGILGEPLELVPCETVDLEVPANAEIVIEGEINLHELESEGPFAEYHFLLGESTESPTFDVSAITHRQQPIYYDIYNPYVDHVNHAVVPMEADIYQSCKETVPQTRDVYIPAASSIMTVVIQIEKNRPGIAKQVGLSAVASNYYVKQAIIVDQEQDLRNLNDVLWALSMKSRPERDWTFIENCFVLRTDPMGTSEEGWPESGPLDTKVIIDATEPLGLDYSERSEPPKELWESIDLEEYNSQ